MSVSSGAKVSDPSSSVPGMSAAARHTAGYRAVQPSLDDLGTPLGQVTFCVVDLETTGSGEDDTITEIGAVKVCGGEVVGEFATLVNPDTHIPALISVLTGITDQLVAGAPKLAGVLPGFLEFARGTVLVAHNAGFDIGFLKRACLRHQQVWPGNPVIDTVALARQALLRDEVPNCKLSTLAAHFRAATQPNHRALSDARATVDVLHGLMERIGNLGVSTLEDLEEFTHRVSPQRRAKRTWAAALPEGPGVYWFYADLPSGAKDAAPRREVLYVGKSVNIRRRVRSYFTASEKRGRMEEMIRVSTGVDHITCATPLEAEVRELRLIASHAPRYNRRSRRQNKVLWVKLTDEAFPRLSIVRQISADRARYWGPFGSRAAAEDACLALYDAHPLRQCTRRLSARTPTAPCALGQMGRCLAPCGLGPAAEQYSTVVAHVRQAMESDVRPTVAGVGARLKVLIAQERFEEAEVVRARLAGYAGATLRWHRLTSITTCPQIVAARRVEDGWHIHVIRWGKLAAAARAMSGQVPQRVAREAVVAAETVLQPAGGLPAGSVEEAERIAAWLESDGIRLIDIEGDWSWPINVGLSDGDLARWALGGPGDAGSGQPGGGDDDQARDPDRDESGRQSRPTAPVGRPGVHSARDAAGDDPTHAAHPVGRADQKVVGHHQGEQDDVGLDVGLRMVLDHSLGSDAPVHGEDGPRHAGRWPHQCQRGGGPQS